MGGPKKDEKTPVKERHGSMRVPLSLVTTLATLAFGRQGMPIRGERALRKGRVPFRVHGKCGQEDVGAMHDKLWDDRHVEVFPSNAPYVEHQAFDRNLCSRSLMVQRIFEQQRKCPKGGGEALPGVSFPPWKGSASRKNHEERMTVARVVVRAQVTLLDAANFSQAKLPTKREVIRGLCC